VGPQRLIDELRDQAPRYAKLLPDLPRLLHDYLRHRHESSRDELQQLVAEQRRTNRLLQTILAVGLGFALGLAATQLAAWARWL